jgi:hypothetical protein
VASPARHSTTAILVAVGHGNRKDNLP